MGIRSKKPRGHAKKSVSIAGGDSWVGIQYLRFMDIHPWPSFNRRWRFLGGDTTISMKPALSWVKFQSQVAILGWGYRRIPEYKIMRVLVSIAGGDSWVGIHCDCKHFSSMEDCFNRRWRFLGGDTLPPFSLRLAV